MTEIIHLHRTQSRKSHTLDNIVEHHHGMPGIAFWQGARDSIQGLHLTLQDHRARDRQTEEEGLLPSIAGIVQLGVSPRFVADVWRKHKGEILDPLNKACKEETGIWSSSKDFNCGTSLRVKAVPFHFHKNKRTHTFKIAASPICVIHI